MSLTGNVKSSGVLRGKIQLLDVMTVNAYAVAVMNGFHGTEEEWLASLKGEKGKSVYDIAAENGYGGTAVEWLESLKFWYAELFASQGTAFESYGYKSKKAELSADFTLIEGDDYLVHYDDNQYYLRCRMSNVEGMAQNYICIGNESLLDPGLWNTDGLQFCIAVVDGVVTAFTLESGTHDIAIYKGVYALENLLPEVSAFDEGKVLAVVDGKWKPTAMRPVKVSSITVYANRWVGTESPYYQVVALDNVTEHSQVDLKPSVEQLNIFHDKDLAFVAENEDGVVTVYAVGDKPTNDYTIQVSITEVVM